MIARCTHLPLRRPFLGSIRSGTRCAPILLSKNSVRKSSREVLANHTPKYPQRWTELRLHLKYGSRRPTSLGRGRRPQRRWTLYSPCKQELPAFLELESAIQTDRHDHEFDCPEPDEELGNQR